MKPDRKGADSQAGWAVVATVDEPPALVQAFVAWYLTLGADAVFLYFDRPDDPVADLFGGVEQVNIVRCDAAYWAAGGKARPDKHQVRQVRNATDAYRQCDAAWLLHCDADEFLVPDVPVADVLAAVESATDGLVVPVAERIFATAQEGDTVFTGPFRRPAKSDRMDDGFTRRGLTGHALGKAFARCGRRMNISVHRPKRGGEDVRLALASELELLHFDGLTPLYWVYKLLRKADALMYHDGMVPSPHRQVQMEKVVGNPKAAFALHDRLKRPDATLLGRLRARNLISDPPFAPEDAIAGVFPDAAVDLSPAAFDDWLWREKAAVLRSFGLRPKA